MLYLSREEKRALKRRARELDTSVTAVVRGWIAGLFSAEAA
jgi:hypothetical protein